MLANSLAVVVAEEAAKRLLIDMNLEHRPKRAERTGFLVAKSLALVQADTWAKREVARDIYELDELLDSAEVSTLSSLEKLVGEIANTGHLLASEVPGMQHFQRSEKIQISEQDTLFSSAKLQGRHLEFQCQEKTAQHGLQLRPDR